MIDDIACVILAGGKSSRMGQDKCFLPFKNKTLIEYQYDRLKKIFKKVYISSKTNKFGFKADLILENSNIFSSLVALKTILNNINDKVFIITVDVPNISKQSIELLVRNSQGYDCCIAKDGTRTHNLLGVYSKCQIKYINTMLNNNEYKIKSLIVKSNYKFVDIKNNIELLNINNKEDYNNLIET